MSKSTGWIVFIAALIVIFLAVRYIQDTSQTKVGKPLVQEDPLHSWKPYSDEEGHFTALFPLAPQHISQQVEDPRTREPRHYKMWIAKKLDQTAFMVTMISFPDRETLGTEGLIETVRDDMLSANPENRLISESRETFLGQPALTFAVSSGHNLFLCKTFLVDHTLYLLSVGARFEEKAQAEEEFNLFTRSFRLTPSKT